MKSKKILYIIDAILLLFLIFIDQLTKYLVVLKLKQSPVTLINGVLEFNYTENRGAAFGMLQDRKTFFVFVAVIFVAVIVFVLIKTPIDKKYNILHVLLVAICAGAIGNLIDRLRLEYVVDFIYFSIIKFPVFNFADICVTVSTIILIILILFVYKDHDFYFLNFKEQKYRETK